MNVLLVEVDLLVRMVIADTLPKREYASKQWPIRLSRGTHWRPFPI